MSSSVGVVGDDVDLEASSSSVGGGDKRRLQATSSDPARQKLLTICGDANTDLPHNIV